MEKYVNKTGVDKLLIEAFEKVVREKPQKPLVFIAEFLLSKSVNY